MATLKQEWKIGDVAYESYTPSKVGVVVEVHDHFYEDRQGNKYRGSQMVTVRTVKGNLLKIFTPADFRALIEDHRRKAEKHEAVLHALGVSLSES